MNINTSHFVITGGARGIGLALAREVTQQGGRVSLVDLDADALTQAVASLPEGLAVAIQADVTKPDDNARATEEAIAAHGNVDVWVNNAGLARHEWIKDYTEAQIDLMMDVNIKGTVLGCQQAMRHMAPNRHGHIINIISTASLRGIPTESFYCATKWAIRGFTQGLVEEAAKDNVRVTALLPGGVDTGFWSDAVDFEVNRSKMLQAKHIADAVLAVVGMDDLCVTREIQVRAMTDADFNPGE